MGIFITKRDKREISCHSKNFESVRAYFFAPLAMQLVAAWVGFSSVNSCQVGLENQTHECSASHFMAYNFVDTILDLLQLE